MYSCVLFSGGPDSLAALEFALQEGPVSRLFYFYAGLGSYQASSSLASHYRIPLTTIHLPEDLLLYPLSPSPASPSYLPDRNLFFLSVVSARIKWELRKKDGGVVRESRVYTGFVRGHPSIYDTFPDFVSALNSLYQLDKEFSLRVVAPFVEFEKEYLYEYLKERGAPISLTYSCFTEDITPCGRCMKCVRREEVLESMRWR